MTERGKSDPAGILESPPDPGSPLPPGVSMDRRDFVRVMGLGAAALSVAGLEACGPRRPPNVVFFLADDLGYGEVGVYGQTRIRTPSIDRIAAEGIRFTQHYSGSPVCAPSRCALLTGLHMGHAYIRDNDEMDERGDVWHDPALEGQRPLLDGTFTLGSLFQNAGYATGAMGKWGLGGPGSTGHPNRQGFDHWYGYLCQRVAHNYYPTHLWRNEEKDLLEGNDYFYPHQRLPEDADPEDPASYEAYSGAIYSQDVIAEEARAFIREHAQEPFFLYLPFTVPHASLQVPEDSLEEYADAFEETPYTGSQGYLPHPKPRAAYAAMVTRMDREVGRILDLLEELGLAEDTLVIFTSDNGPTFNGGTDSAFFDSAAGLRGLKTQLWEGGIRVPLVARWPGRIPPGTVSDLPSAFWDFLPTFAELLEQPLPVPTDGLSLLPTLGGSRRTQEEHEYLYWEFQGRQAVRMGDWKAYRTAADGRFELFDLAADPGEEVEVSTGNPEVVARITDILDGARTESELFPLVREGSDQA
jgi:arylsulfatase A